MSLSAKRGARSVAHVRRGVRPVALFGVLVAAPIGEAPSPWIASSPMLMGVPPTSAASTESIAAAATGR